MCVTWFKTEDQSFVCVTWFIDIYDRICVHVWGDLFICDVEAVVKRQVHVGRLFVCVVWRIHMCHVTRSYVWDVSFICVTWLIHMCDLTHSYVWHDSFICVTWLSTWNTLDLERLGKLKNILCVSAACQHDAFICVTWLIHTCEIVQYAEDVGFGETRRNQRTCCACLPCAADVAADAGVCYRCRSRVAVCCSLLQCVVGCYSVLQCAAVCCSVLQHVAACCSVLHCVAVFYFRWYHSYQKTSAAIPHGTLCAPDAYRNRPLFPKTQFTTELTICNDYRADFWEIMWLTARVCRVLPLPVRATQHLPAPQSPPRHYSKKSLYSWVMDS